MSVSFLESLERARPINDRGFKSGNDGNEPKPPKQPPINDPNGNPEGGNEHRREIVIDPL